MMDAIGKWKNGVLIAVKNYGNACAHNAQSPATFKLEQAQEMAYVAVCNELRTTPEGYMLVPDKPTCWMYTGKVTGTKSFSTVQHDKDSSPPEYFDETPLYAAPPPKSEPL